jgi:hypothetical protein
MGITNGLNYDQLYACTTSDLGLTKLKALDFCCTECTGSQWGVYCIVHVKMVVQARALLRVVQGGSGVSTGQCSQVDHWRTDR